MARLSRRRDRYWPPCVAAALALLLGTSGWLAPAEAAITGAVAEAIVGARAAALGSLPGQALTLPPLSLGAYWGAGLAALLCLGLPPATVPSRRGGWRGLPRCLLPPLLSILLGLAAGRWLPALAPALAVLATVLLHVAWQARDIRRVRGAAALRWAMRRAMRDEAALPCSLLRLHLHGGAGNGRLPWREILPCLQARTRRGGDRLARCGRAGAALWLVNTDARAVEHFAGELRADLACVLARHDLHCRLGWTTLHTAGGDPRALWEAARPG